MILMGAHVGKIKLYDIPVLQYFGRAIELNKYVITVTPSSLIRFAFFYFRECVTVVSVLAEEFTRSHMGMTEDSTGRTMLDYCSPE
jgi:hypothetical protein